MLVDVLVEGDLDAVVAERLLAEAGLTLAQTYGRKGAGYIKNNCAKYDAASEERPILVLVDLRDTGESCAPTVMSTWLPQRHPSTLFRCAMWEIESWLIADQIGISKFLRMSSASFSKSPERIRRPKRFLIEQVEHHCKVAKIRNALVPNDLNQTTEGPLYTAEMSRFARDHWDLESAMARSESLKRCVGRLKELSS